MEPIRLSYCSLKTELARLHLVANQTHLLILAFDENWPTLKARLERDAEKNGFELKFLRNENKWIEKARGELDEYFAGSRTRFTIPVETRGTEFEKKVWNLLSKIPFGQLTTYAEHAAKAKRPEAIRAVAAANARNPVSILVPCHRVISASGHLTGYSGGVKLKQRLLEIEGAMK